MKINRLLCAVGVVLVFAAGASAQEFWEKKPYTEWNKDQCKKLLESGPWAAHTGARDVQNLAFSGGSTAGEESERRIDYYAQIRSALPVRQAVLRRAMIDSKYDKMPAEQKKIFDESAAAYLARDYSDKIVIVVEYGSNVERVDRDLARFWQGFPEGTFPASTYLVGHNGLRVAPLSFKADGGAGRSFQLTFPRTVDGQPLVTEETKVLRLEVPTPMFSATDRGTALSSGGQGDPAANVGTGSRGLAESRGFFEFKIQKMKYKGETIF